MTWTAVCPYEDLQPERGVAALVGTEQVALFRTFDGSLYAIGNQDPFTGVFVLSRGIVGTRGDIPTVTSPLHKQVFDLRTGVARRAAARRRADAAPRGRRGDRGPGLPLGAA